MEVIFSEERSKNAEELDKVRQFLPIFKEHAEYLNMPISIDVLRGEPLDPIDDNNFHIHVFSSPVKVWVGDRMISKIFGFPLPYLAALGVGSGGEDFSSPEDEVIAKICHKNIYILLDFFHESWNGQDLVLDQILEEAIPRALDLEIAKEYQSSLVKACRGRMKNNMASTKENFSHLCLTAISSKLEEVRAVADTLREQHEEVTQKLAKVLFDFEVVRDELQELESSEARNLEEYGEEFDLILKTKNILGLRVKKDDNEPKLISVFTDRLFLKTEIKESCYDIGNFEISIHLGKIVDSNRYNSPVDWCTIKQGSYSGPHLHREMNVPTVCFGTDSQFGYNVEVNKLYHDGDFLSIIQWAMVLLEMDSRGPSASTGSGLIYIPPALFYASIEDMEQERQNYAQAVSYAREKLFKDQLQKKMKETLKVLKFEADKFSQIRLSLKNILWIKDFLEKKSAVRYDQAQKEFTNLCQEKGIIEVGVIGEALRIFTHYESSLVSFWINPATGQIWARSSNPDLEKNITLLNRGEEASFYKVLLPLISQGKLAKAAILLREFFIGDENE